MAERAASEEHAALLREELRQANRLATLGQVSAGIAHETAQPIAAIRAYAENGLAFLERAEPQAAQDNFTAIRRLTDRLSTITAQLRGFARRAEDEQQSMSLASAVEGALLILRPRLKGIVCLAEPGDVPAVRASRVKLEQVLVNLLQNAADALAETPSPTIHLSCAVKEDHLVLTITDNGPGIAPEIAARLFTPFATSRKSGLGLGLVIARDIMREMGGDLQWRPQPGGAVFDVTLVRA
jgi:two-component system C4-dicarboxylate transport sensor histidine kinase DctB